MSKHYLGQIKVNNDIVSIFVKREDEDSIGFYDSFGNFIAQKEPNYQLLPAEQYRNMPPEFLTQIDSLWQDIMKNGISLDTQNRDLERFSGILGIDKERVMSSSSIGLSQKVDETPKKDDKKLEIDDRKDNTITHKNNNEVLDSISAKTEIELDKLVDDRYTLGEILGIDDPNATLICVHSIDIKSTSRSNSEFSFLIKYPDGRLEKADMLSQEDGTSPDRDVYSSNRDGSDVNKVGVRSMYRIKSPTGKESMISVSYGTAGTLDFQYGKRDITKQDFMSVPLESSYSRYVTKEVQDSLDPERGIYQAHKSAKEASSHMDKGCDNLTLKEADGNENTGHQHLDDNHMLMIAANILDKNPELDEFYSTKGLADDLKKYLNNHPDRTIEDFTKDRLADCEHYPSMQK